MTFEEMKDLYPEQWLAIAYTELNDDMAVRRGKVLAHSSDRDEIYRCLLALGSQSIAIEYTGEIPEDLAVML